MKNPFYFRVVPIEAAFCNREKELQELIRHAQNCANVVLISPRRYGKTSLVKRAQDTLSKKGIITVYIDLYGVSSMEDVASRIASDIYRAVHKQQSLFDRLTRYISLFRPVISVDPLSGGGMSVGVDVVKGRTGKELLEHALSGLSTATQESELVWNIAIDEFQEIVELKEYKYIEGTMRSYIQLQNKVSYFFVGSRRRILSDMFNNKNRAFYKSAINLQIDVLPEKELVEYLIGKFSSAGKVCAEETAKKICEFSRRNPYYSQKLGYHIFEICSGVVTEEDVVQGYINLMEDEKNIFEMMTRGLTSRQIALLAALAKEPAQFVFSHEYISRHNLGSVGAVQVGVKKLIHFDYIEEKDGVLQVVDPVFADWLKRK